jgi:nitroreductase
MQKFLKRILPKFVQLFLCKLLSNFKEVKGLAFECYRDARDYRLYSSNAFYNSDDAKNLSAMIFMEAHALEKGFSMPEVRLGYGYPRIRKLVGLLNLYRLKGFKLDDLSIRKAQSVLREYAKFHDDKGFDISEISSLISPWIQTESDIAGFLELTKDDLLESSVSSFDSFASSRWSIRNYTEEEVSEDVIRRAIEIAKKTPSVCNRQPWRVYAIKDRSVQTRVLALQNGNRGFGHTASYALVVTSDLKCFVGVTERNEAYVDGGMFAMSLLYALHNQGVGACPLNWMVPSSLDVALRSILSIPPNEKVVMIIAVGHIPEKLRVAKSVRYPVEHFVKFI